MAHCRENAINDEPDVNGRQENSRDLGDGLNASFPKDSRDGITEYKNDLCYGRVGGEGMADHKQREAV